MLAALSALAAIAKPAPHRPPAIPLIVHDPYFSVWSFSDHPADDWTKHWTGKNHAVCGMFRVDGQAYRWLSRGQSTVPTAELVATTVRATTTEYVFRAGSVRFVASFVTPVMAGNPEAASRTATLVEIAAYNEGDKPVQVSAYLDISAELAVDSPDQTVAASRLRAESGDVLTLWHDGGEPLGRSGDDIRIDWGRAMLTQHQRGMDVIASHDEARAAFATRGGLPREDDLRFPRRASDTWPVAACATLPEAALPGGDPVIARFVVAYDDQYSIEYFGRKLPPLWRDRQEGLSTLVSSPVSLAEAARRFDSREWERWVAAGGEGYARLCALAYRQCLGAHKTVRDADGRIRTFSKENFSNGCIGTVDVMYPATPFFLVYEPDLIESQMLPVLEYASMSRWKWPFAPHDLGTYPLANGQVYGGGERTEENQMPVEECGNMLVMLGALAELHGEIELAREFWPVISKWARYLERNGLDPGEQLCTDDFSGHLAHNANLSMKAIVGLACYARVADRLNHKEEAQKYSALARAWAQEWVTKVGSAEDSVLAFDKPGTWSQKYNMVWDKVLGLGLFPPDAYARETATALRHANAFGTPLDSRADYTKLDWIVWTACLAPTRRDRDRILAPVYRWLEEGPDRVPLSDWYNTKTGRVVGFRARSVVGAVFLPLLLEDK